MFHGQIIAEYVLHNCYDTISIYHYLYVGQYPCPLAVLGQCHLAGNDVTSQLHLNATIAPSCYFSASCDSVYFQRKYISSCSEIEPSVFSQKVYILQSLNCYRQALFCDKNIIKVHIFYLVLYCLSIYSGLKYYHLQLVTSSDFLVSNCKLSEYDFVRKCLE